MFSFNENADKKVEMSYQFGTFCSFVISIHVTTTKCFVVCKERENHHI